MIPARHTGGNDLQNFGLAGALQTIGSGVHIAARSAPLHRNRSPSSSSRAACDPSGFGQESALSRLDDDRHRLRGNATFAVTLAAAEFRRVITATATQVSTGNTSEFSACALSPPPSC
jgi:hypothetical protein